MTGLLVPLIFSGIAVIGGTFCRFKGSRYLLIGVGALTGVSLLIVLCISLIGASMGCSGESVRAMSCPEGSIMTGLLLPLGKIATNLSLPGLLIGPFAAPFALLAEFWARRNNKV